MTTDGFDQRLQPGDVNATLLFLSWQSGLRCNFLACRNE